MPLRFVLPLPEELAKFSRELTELGMNRFVK